MESEKKWQVLEDEKIRIKHPRTLTWLWHLKIGSRPPFWRADSYWKASFFSFHLSFLECNWCESCLLPPLSFEAGSHKKSQQNLGGELPGYHGRKPLLATFNQRNPTPNVKDIFFFIWFFRWCRMFFFHQQYHLDLAKGAQLITGPYQKLVQWSHSHCFRAGPKVSRIVK